MMITIFPTPGSHPIDSTLRSELSGKYIYRIHRKRLPKIDIDQKPSLTFISDKLMVRTTRLLRT